jgi:hypothetical protein
MPEEKLPPQGLNRIQRIPDGDMQWYALAHCGGIH